MTFEDFSWDYCSDSTYDFTKHKYVWCTLKNESCKKSTCPKIKEYQYRLKEEELLSILKAPSHIVKKFQKEQGLIIDGVPGPKVKQRIEYLIVKEKLKI